MTGGRRVAAAWRGAYRPIARAVALLAAVSLHLAAWGLLGQRGEPGHRTGLSPQPAPRIEAPAMMIRIVTQPPSSATTPVTAAASTPAAAPVSAAVSVSAAASVSAPTSATAARVASPVTGHAGPAEQAPSALASMPPLPPDAESSRDVEEGMATAAPDEAPDRDPPDRDPPASPAGGVIAADIRPAGPISLPQGWGWLSTERRLRDRAQAARATAIVGTPPTPCAIDLSGVEQAQACR